MQNMIVQIGECAVVFVLVVWMEWRLCWLCGWSGVCVVFVNGVVFV